MPVPFTTEWVSRNVVNVHVTLPRKGDEAWFLVMSDVHFDSAKCRRDLLRRDLDEAKRRNAGIIDNGDFFDLMQQRGDPRSKQAELRPEHRFDNYFDRVIDTAAEWLEPYKDHLISMGHGNHETSYLRYHGTDPTAKLCENMRAKYECRAKPHGYTGFLFFRCHRRRQQQSILLYRDHGHGGDAPSTKGTLHVVRRAAEFPNPQILLQGHNHHKWTMWQPQTLITRNGKQYVQSQCHVCIPGYKDGRGDGHEGFEVEKGHATKANGSAWLQIYNDAGRENPMFHYRVTHTDD